MTELEKMQRAKMYIEKLANGINPLDGTSISGSDVLNNIRISRCLFYVSDVLRQVIDNKGVNGEFKLKKKPFSISSDEIKNFSFSSTPISVSEITKRLNILKDMDSCYKLKHTAITSWLIEIGALDLLETSNGENIKRPTKQGEALGILLENRTGINGDYTVVVYNQDAQQFIIDNIDAIIEKNNAKTSEEANNHGQAWTPTQEECLIDLFNKSVPISEIAITLKRTKSGIRARLRKLGLIDKKA